MSKPPVLLVALVLGLLAFAACSTTQPEPSASPGATDSSTTSPTKSTTIGAPGGSRSVEPDEVRSTAPYKTISMKVTDQDGYRLLLTIKLSKWIRVKDTDMAGAAWHGIGGRGDAPLLADTNAGGARYVASSAAAVLYGNATVTNLSPEFELSRFGSGSAGIVLTPFYVKNGERKNYTEVMYQFGPLVSAADYSTGIQFTSYPGSPFLPGILNPKITKDHWGPAAFAIGFSKVLTPKSPDGSALDDVLFCAGIGAAPCKNGPWFGKTYEGDTKAFSVVRSWIR